jgi:hypothetical protein
MAWTLNARSWYGYVLNEAAHCVWLPAGALEKLDGSLVLKLAIEDRVSVLRLGYETLLNRFAAFSGPNCFAAVAGAIIDDSRLEICSQWIHWASLERLLLQRDFQPVQSGEPRIGDVLAFAKERVPVHAAYFLGDGIYFEKPGQDFYEPYRVEFFDKWPEAWSGATLSIWRTRRR